MKKIGVVYNPFAGSNKVAPDKRKNKLQKILGERGVLRETRSVEDIDKVAREFRDMGIDVLAISGGDGTNHCVLTRFYHLYGEEMPLLYLLRGGTMNLLEKSLKFSGNPEQRLQKLVRSLEKGKCPVMRHTMLRVNDKYGYIFGNGMIANVMQEYYRGGDTGLKKALRLFCKACCSYFSDIKFIKRLFKPIQAHVQIGDEVLPDTDFTALMAATEKECGLGFKPFYRAREEQGKLHFLAVKLDAGELIRSLPRFRSGKKIRSDNVYEVVTDRVVIDTFEPYYYTLDGEMLNSTTRLEVASGPVLRIVAL